MHTAVRAHRILTALTNYQEAGKVDDWPAELSGVHLGEPIGWYRNPGPQGDVIGIFADGLGWSQNGQAVDLVFADIVEVTLPSGKESEGLLLMVRDGRQLQLPVKGQRGQFFDSMEMLRFLDRVMQDLGRQEQESIA